MAQFDPSQPYEIVDQGAKSAPAFDPMKPYEIVPDVSEPESVLRGAAQGATFGFADEGEGALKALYNKYQGSPKSLTDLYTEARDKARTANDAASIQNPKSYLAGQLGGAVAPALLSGGASIPALAAQGALQGLGSSKADLTQGDIAGAGTDALTGGVVGGALGAAGEYLAPVVGRGLDALGNTLKSGAEGLATNATGATGLQASRFADDAGRQLLDRGLVKFGDSADNIADRVTQASTDAGSAIQNTLQQLDQMGIKSSVDNVKAALEKKVAQLSQTPGNEATVKQIQNQIDNLTARGQSELPISQGEDAKRNFQSQVNYFSPEAEKKGATYAADAFRQETERAANAADPGLADTFKQDKDTYGLLAPIKEAAMRRSTTLNQAPFGGLGDLAAIGAGAVTGVGGVPAVVAKRLIFPRISSSGAVLADNLADAVKATPQVFGRFAAPLQAAAARGGTSLAATNFILQQTNPEYRSLVLGKDNENKDGE